MSDPASSVQSAQDGILQKLYQTLRKAEMTAATQSLLSKVDLVRTDNMRREFASFKQREYSGTLMDAFVEASRVASGAVNNFLVSELEKLWLAGRQFPETFYRSVFEDTGYQPPLVDEKLQASTCRADTSTFYTEALKMGSGVRKTQSGTYTSETELGWEERKGVTAYLRENLSKLWDAGAKFAEGYWGEKRG
jgi:hypothetical protein